MEDSQLESPDSEEEACRSAELLQAGSVASADRVKE